MQNKTKIILGGIGATLIVGAGVFILQPEDKVTLDNPQLIVWEKPTTDEAWVEDVKVESFDIKSTEVLETMRDTHRAKLEKVVNGKREVFECPQCIKFDLEVAHPEWSATDIDNEYQNQVKQATWEVEKLKQSIERMEKELELRDKKFVVVEGESMPVFGSVNSKYIRHIND